MRDILGLIAVLLVGVLVASHFYSAVEAVVYPYHRYVTIGAAVSAAAYVVLAMTQRR